VIFSSMLLQACGGHSSASPVELHHWRIVSSGMLHRVALVRTDVSEESSASFIRVARIGELGTTLAVTSNRRTLRRNTKSVLTRATWRNIPEDTILHSHRRENLKSSIAPSLYMLQTGFIIFCTGACT
jgi:hypothetical protein